MTTRLLTATLTATLMLSAAAAHAGNLFSFEARVRRYATSQLHDYKNPCVCMVGPDEGRAGIVRYAINAPTLGTRRIRVWCQVTEFDSAGQPETSQACYTFVPLAS